jgi:hypothetical protein
VTVSGRTGTGGATDVWLTVELPAGAGVASANANRGPGCTTGATAVRCYLDFISPGTDGNVVIVAALGGAGGKRAVATLRLAQKDAADADNTAVAELTVVDPAAPVAVPNVPAPAAPQPAAPPVRPAPSRPKPVTLPRIAKPAGRAVTGALLRAPAAPPGRKVAAYQWQIQRRGGRFIPIARARTRTLALAPSMAGGRVRVAVTLTVGKRKQVAFSPATAWIRRA